MKTILRHLSEKLVSSENDIQDLHRYTDMFKHPGWAVHQNLLLMMRGLMAESLLSERFTNMDAKDKDVQQRTYHEVDNVINFLINPVDRAQKIGAIKRHNQEMEASTKKKK